MDKFRRFAGPKVPIMLLTAGERFHAYAERDVPLWWPSAGSFACVRRTERFRPRGFGRTTRPRGFGRHGVPSIEVGLKNAFSGCVRPHPFCSGMGPAVQEAMVSHAQGQAWKELMITILERLWPRIECFFRVVGTALAVDKVPLPGMVFTCRQGRHRSVATAVPNLVVGPARHGPRNSPADSHCAREPASAAVV